MNWDDLKANEQKVLGFLLVRISDAAKDEKGVSYMVELLHHLIQLRDIQELCQDDSIQGLAKLLIFQAQLRRALERDMHSIQQNAWVSSTEFESRLVNDLLKHLPYDKNQKCPRYPIVYIPLLECLEVMENLHTTSLVHYLLSYFFERSFSHLRFLLSNASWPSQPPDEQLVLVSRIVCIIDFTDLPSYTFTNSSLRGLIHSIFHVIWSYAKTFLYAIVFHHPQFSTESLDTWMQFNQEGFQLSHLLFFVTRNLDQLHHLLKIRKYETTLGGYNDPHLFHYVCNKNRNILQTFRLPYSTPQTFPEMDEHLLHHDARDSTDIPHINTPYLQKNPLLSSSHVPSSARLWDHLDHTFTHLHKALSHPGGLSTFLQASKDHGTSLKDMGIILRKPGTFSKDSSTPKLSCPTIAHTQNVSKPTTHVCFWKRKNYNQLVYYDTL